MFETYIGTANGVYVLHDGEPAPLGLGGQRITAIHAWREHATTAVLAGSYGSGLYRSEDGGGEWSRVEAGLTAPALRFLGPDRGQSGALLAGTEPGRIFRSDDGGRSWRELEGFAALPGRERWFLPYSPRAGAVRNIHTSPGRPERLLASVEVGGLARSDDGGGTWVCEPVIADEDIHHITGHPHDDDLLYVSLGTASLGSGARGEPRPRLGGIARSHDGGRSWQKVETDYTRATLIPSSRPGLLLAGPARRVGRAGRIVVSTDGGDTWRPAAGGVEIPMPDMVEQFAESPDGDVWAICSQGRLLRAEAGAWTWRSALPATADLEVQSIGFLEAARSSTSIRFAEIGERDALEALQRRSSLHQPMYRAQLVANPDAIELPAEQIAAGLVRVAEQDGVVVGFAVLLEPSGNGCELDGLFVEPDRMRAGVGRALVDDARRIARSRGARRIDLVANPQAVAFYEAVGFVLTGEARTRFGLAPRMSLPVDG